MHTALSIMNKTDKSLMCSNHREVSRSDPVQEPHHERAMSNPDSGKRTELGCGNKLCMEVLKRHTCNISIVCVHAA